MIIRTRFAQSHIKKEKTEIKRIINVLRKLIFSLRKVLKNESLSKNMCTQGRIETLSRNESNFHNFKI